MQACIAPHTWRYVHVSHMCARMHIPHAWVLLTGGVQTHMAWPPREATRSAHHPLRVPCRLPIQGQATYRIVLGLLAVLPDDAAATTTPSSIWAALALVAAPAAILSVGHRHRRRSGRRSAPP